jgi:ATP-dependent RNA helicase DDX41
LIFCDKIQDVDDVHEYLLIKGVDSASLHGGKCKKKKKANDKIY